MKEYALAIHGGAGLTDRNLEGAEDYLEALEGVLRAGVGWLEDGVSSLDVVERTIEMLEECPLFNAGRGAVFNRLGAHELDAAIMDGRTLSCGAVTCVRTVRNPIRLARLVMERTPHLLLAGDGAEEFAREMGLERMDPHFFFTERRYRQLKQARNLQRVALDHEFGTVGAVALDRERNLAAGSSTGGMINKMPGRVGDTPIVGAGLFADNRTCAVSCTGRGERFLGQVVAHRISDRVEFGGMDLEQAVEESLRQRLSPGDGGVIAVDPSGRLVLEKTAVGMFRGAADSGGRFEVAIW
ncbi:MAG: isoaspartyl peptidase/L-asparaginase [Armatimonadetes bacterium]|nr:isoaspartyl peptidase/L-asparaginase [Armatimonadota bacterium]